MTRIVRIGVDLAKNVMQLHGVEVAERVVIRKAVTREKFLEWFANLAPCVVAMEACTASHFWARRLREYGHGVRLIPPQFAAPYRKGGSSVKNDALDAEAICEAASRPHMRYVPVKTPAQLGALVLHRMRQGLIEEWAVAAAFSGYIAVLRVETIAAQHEAKTATASIDFYKQAAAKAYTQMLMAKGRAGDSAALIPAGTRVECNMTYSQIAGKPVGKCEGPLFFPPRIFVN